MASKNKIEGFVIDRIKSYILTDENLSELIRITNEEIEALFEGENEHVKMLDRQIRDVDSGLEHLYNALETGKFGIDELASRIHALVARKAELQSARDKVAAALQAKKLALEDVEVMRHYAEDLRSSLGSASIMEQRAFPSRLLRGSMSLTPRLQ